MPSFVNRSFVLGLACFGAVVGFVQCTDCPDGWVAFEGSCYLFLHGVTHTFVSAEAFCRQHTNGHLVEIASKTENLFLKDFLRGFGGPCYWIGLTDELVEGNWVWYNSKTSPLFFDWNPTEPSPGDGEDCAVFWEPFNYNWGDVPCDYKCQPVCKISGGGESGNIVG